MSQPKVLKCAICGLGRNEMILDDMNFTAYCRDHENFLGVSNWYIGECPKCKYRFDKGNADFFYRDKENTRCPNCNDSLRPHNVDVGIFLSEFSASTDKCKAMGGLVSIIAKGNRDPYDGIVVKHLISVVKNKWFRKSCSSYEVSADDLVTALVLVIGTDSKQVLQDWSRLFSRLDRKIKKAAREKLKQL